MENRTVIRDFYGKILGYVYTDSDGNQRVTDFYGKILGKYDSKFDHTTDFYGRILGKGNFVVSLIYSNDKK